jgi:hypothetical protein
LISPKTMLRHSSKSLTSSRKRKVTGATTINKSSTYSTTYASRCITKYRTTSDTYYFTLFLI